MAVRIIYRKILDSSDTDKLHRDQNRLGEWVVENEMKIGLCLIFTGLCIALYSYSTTNKMQHLL